MNTALHYLIIFIVVFFKLSTAQTPLYIDIWVVWNVGQGQWITHILADECLHYDIGGEFGSFNPLKDDLITNCGYKMNVLHLSHWDYDHFLNILPLARTLPYICWRHYPYPISEKKSPQRVLTLRIPSCSTGLSRKAWTWQPKTFQSSNDSSSVFWEQFVLIPGDSPRKQERYWLRSLQTVVHLSRVLILGHHGSRTSTGLPLLSSMPRLRYAIASARYRRYRHPHPETITRLDQFQIPVLRTEDWGNIWFKP